MGLAQLQSTLALLCTDAAARARWEQNPDAFAEAAGLNATEQAWLTEELHRSIQEFASTLLAKRAHECARALPRTRAALGEAYRSHFATFAGRHSPARDPASEAIAFLRWLPAQRDLSATHYAAAELDSAWLHVARSPRRLYVRLFRHPGRTFLALWWRRRRTDPWRYHEYLPLAK